MKSIKLFFFSVLFLPLISWCQSPITLSISNFKNVKGSVLISVFSQADGFPNEEKKAQVKFKINSFHSTNITHKINGLKPGTYAISILHDENNDAICNLNALGIPSEGIGTSNNAKAVLGPPKFADAQFNYTGEALSLTIKIKYF